MSDVDATHDPGLTSWVRSAGVPHHDFPIQNLPLGVFEPRGKLPRGGIAIGDEILDLQALATSGLLRGQALEAARVACAPQLNALLALQASSRVALRRQVSLLLGDATWRADVEPMLHSAAECTMHLPTRIGDYTDFYAGIHHAIHVGRLYRAENPLLPNYKHVPIGYHGRASSVRVSGMPVQRPSGQFKGPGEAAPQFGPSQRLDYELELGVWIGQGNALGDPIAIDEAMHHIAGLSLLNDWSARDLQAWEYQPLGPFLSKNFLTSVSPWIVTLEALAPFRVPQPARPAGDPRPLRYLWSEADQAQGAFALSLEVALRTRRMREQGLPAQRLSLGSATTMYWTVAQMIAHHTCGGCNLNPGDLLGTGTISAPDASGCGSLLEISRDGNDPVLLRGGETRCFLLDGDEVVMTARAQAKGFVPIGFGACRGVVVDRPTEIRTSQ